MLEGDYLSSPGTFVRARTSRLQSPDAGRVCRAVIGRFQRASEMTRSRLHEIVARQPALTGLPVLANVDFGHPSPFATLPIGGDARLVVAERSELTITEP